MAINFVHLPFTTYEHCNRTIKAISQVCETFVKWLASIQVLYSQQHFCLQDCYDVFFLCVFF